MKTNHWATVITTIAIFLFGLFWVTIDGQLKALDTRLRCVEQQIAAISERLGVENRDRADSQRPSARQPAASRLQENNPDTPIAP